MKYLFMFLAVVSLSTQSLTPARVQISASSGKATGQKAAELKASAEKSLPTIETLCDD